LGSFFQFTQWPAAVGFVFLKNGAPRRRRRLRGVRIPASLLNLLSQNSPQQSKPVWLRFFKTTPASNVWLRIANCPNDVVSFRKNRSFFAFHSHRAAKKSRLLRALGWPLTFQFPIFTSIGHDATAR